MAEGILGLGSGQASTLNQELIEKLKTADRAASVAPIETDLEEIDLESVKLDEIKLYTQDLLDSVKNFDLFVTSGVNAFDEKSATTTGESVLFDAVDAASLNTGTTSVSIASLAQKDVFQSSTFSDKTATVSSSTDDMLIISQADRPVYQSDVTVTSSTNTTGGSGTITIDGVDFDVTTDTTFADLVDNINENENFSARINNLGRLTVTHSDGKSELTISESLTKSIGLSLGEKFSTNGNSYEDLADNVNSNTNYNASIEEIGTDSFRLVIKSNESGLDNALQITESGVNLGLNEFTSENSIYTIESSSDTFGADATGTTVLTGNTSITLSSNGSDTSVSIATGTTFSSLVSTINGLSGYSATLNATGSISITADDGSEVTINNNDSGLNFSKILDDNLSLVIEGKTFTSSNESADDFISRINSDSDFTASIDGSGTVSLRNSDGSPLDITSDDIGLSLTNDNHTLSAQNLQATVDGIDYNVSSNLITVEGSLKISAVKVGDSTITIEKDTSSITTSFETLIEKYNSLVDIVDSELYSADSTIDDKSTLRNLLSQVKDFLFSDYGKEGNLNLFNYGLSLDDATYSGKITLDSTAFNTAINDNYDDLKNLFVGVAEAEGFGTQLKEYMDGLTGFEGLLTSYEDNIAERKENLEEDKTKAEEDLDSRYNSLYEQFADYNVIITKFNQQFASLEMMIDQASS